MHRAPVLTLTKVLAVEDDYSFSDDSEDDVNNSGRSSIDFGSEPSPTRMYSQAILNRAHIYPGRRTETVRQPRSSVPGASQQRDECNVYSCTFGRVCAAQTVLHFPYRSSLEQHQALEIFSIWLL